MIAEIQVMERATPSRPFFRRLIPPVGLAMPTNWSMAPSFFTPCELDSHAETMIRKWNHEEPKPCEANLGRALLDVGLTSYTAKAESWCSEMGAAFISEILEEFDGLCDALSPQSGGTPLSVMQKLRLRQALEALICQDS